MPALPYWLWPGDGRPTREIDSEITEELQLHLDLLAEEHERRGLARDDAKRQAAERFGDFDSILRRCRVEKQGDVPMLKRTQAILTLLLLVGVVFLGVRDYVTAGATARHMDQTTGFLKSIQGDLSDLRSELASVSATRMTTPVSPQRADNLPSNRLPDSLRDEWTANEGAKQARRREAERLRREEASITARNRLTTTQLHLESLQNQHQAMKAVREEALADADSKVATAERAVRVAEVNLEAAEAKYGLAMAEYEQSAKRQEDGTASDVDEARANQALTEANAATKLGRLEVEQAMSRLQDRERERKAKSSEWEAKVKQITAEIERAKADVEQAKASSWSGPSTFGGVNGGVRENAFSSYVKRARTRADLTGSATDADGKPIADADVLLIVKTWPNNRFRQDDYAVKTDESGAFVLKGRIPLDGQYGVNAVVVAEGHAIASQYVLVKDPAGEPPEELKFELGESTITRLIVTDSDGAPLAKALVAPSGRVDENDNETLVYHQGSNQAWKKTDADGVVMIDWFSPGDLGKVSIRPRGGEWQEKKFDVTEGGTVEVTVED